MIRRLGPLLLCAALALPAGANGAEGDPLEPVNRGIGWFNDIVDRYVLLPTSKGWHAITPEGVRTCLNNAFRNLSFPRYFANDLLQGDVQQSGVELGRFLVNTTAGVGGLFDPAARLGWQSRNEDTGQTLGVWGVPPGPYLMLPVLGPSTLRDAVGLPLDTVLDLPSVFANAWVRTGITVADRVNTRADLREIDDLRTSSLDFYVAVRDVYLQNRASMIRNGAAPEQTPDDDFYELEDDADE